MNIKRKRIISFFMAFAMILSSFNFNLFIPNKVYAQETTTIENVQKDVTIDDTIKNLVDYFEKTYYTRHGGTVDANTYMALKKAGVDLSTGKWTKDEKPEDNKEIGTKARQANVLIEMGEEPLDLINAMAEQIESMDINTRFPINEVNAAVVMDKFNEKFSDKKVNYKVENIVELIKKNQKKDGSFDVTPQNTAAALNFLVKHKDIDGVDKIIEDELKFLHEVQKEDGGLYKKNFFTHLHCEAVVGLIGADENLTDTKWSKDGKTPIEGLFKYWDGKKICDKNGSIDEKNYGKVLFALVSLKEAGYGDYVLKGIKFDNITKEEPEKTCKANIIIVYPSGDKKYDIKLKPSEVTISNKKQYGLTILGALQAATDQYEAKGVMVTSIFGIENEGNNGWMYSLNGKVPDTYANETEVKDGDKIVWYYSKNGMDENKVPTWEQLTDKDTNTENTKIDKAINDVKEYYKGLDGSKVYDYITSMALRFSGVDASEIASKANIYGNSSLHNIARNTMNIIAMGENPRNYKDKDYVNLILNDKNKFYEDSSCEYVAKAIIALDMAQAEYDSEKAIKALISKAHDEGDGKYSFGSEEYDNYSDTYDYNVNIDYTIAVLTAIANHKNVEGVTEKINGIKKYLKELQTNNGFIKQKTPWSEEESCHITANLIQALIVLGENPLSDEWTKKDEKGNKITMLDAVLSCKEGNRFKGNIKSGMASDIDTSAAFAALVDLSKNKSMYNELRYKKVAKPSVIKIKGESEISLIQGEERLITAEAFDSNGIKVENAEFVWESSDKNICSVENGKLKAIKDGKTDIIVKLLNDTKIFTTINVTVTKNEDYHSKIGKALDKLKAYYDKHNSYDYMSALALHHISDDLNSDLKKIDSNLRLYTKDCAIHYAKNIMEIIAVGKNPECYNNKNYIKLLVDSQNENGEFIVNSSADEDKIVTLALSIIALDMANADYNVEKAVNRLVSMIKDGKHGIDGLYTEIETKAIAITALSKYKHIAGVKETINSSLEYIKNNQNGDAGFDHAGYSNNAFAIGTVIQALIANDIDPLIWIKNGKTMVDVLIERQMDNGGFEYNEHLPNTPEDEIFDDFKCTETAFAALADMYNNKSMYNEIKLNIVEKIEIKNLTDVKEFKLGTDAKITVQVINNTKEAKNAVLIVGLFDEDEKFVNYVAARQSIESAKTVELDGVIKLPKEGKYTVKAFVWDGLEDMTPLSNVIKIPVK